MRQRLAVARAFLHNPSVLLLDEPFTALDDRAIGVLQALLQAALREGRTIVIITHVPWVAAEYAERALLMAQGQLLWDGPLRDLCARTDLCTRASFRPPDITRLGLHLGVVPLSVEECVGWVRGKEAISERRSAVNQKRTAP